MSSDSTRMVPGSSTAGSLRDAEMLRASKLVRCQAPSKPIPGSEVLANPLAAAGRTGRDDGIVAYVTTYKQSRLRREFMDWRRRHQLRTDGYDLVIDLLQRKTVVRRADGNPPLIHQPSVHGVGEKVFALLIKLLRQPGVFLTPVQLGWMKPYCDSHHACAESYICRIRKHVLGETHAHQHFILGAPGPSYAFNPELSFCLIEKEP